MRLTAADYEGYLDNENVQRALATIRATEGTATRADPYRVGFGFSTIGDLSEHPNTSRSFRETTGRKNRSTAAGAYQMLSGTWREVRDRLGLPDFSPRSQDIAAVAKIDQRGALDNVLAGDLKGFVDKVGNEWASMPSSRYNQPKKSQKFVEDAWSNYRTTVPNAPKPKAAPYGLLTTPDVVAASSIPTGLLGKESRLASAQPRNVPTPTPRPSNVVPGVGVARVDPSRFGTYSPMQAPRSMMDRYAETRPGLKGSRVAPQTVTAGLAPTPEQEANLAERLGPREPSTASRIARAATGLLGVTPAAAAEVPTGGILGPTTNFAGPAGSPRSIEGQQIAAARIGLLGNVPTPTAAPRPSPITTTRTVADAPRVATPQRTAIQSPVAAPTARPATTYAPSVPTVDNPISQPEEKTGRSWQQKAAVVGASILGGAVAGPVGGLIGGYVGNQMVNNGLLSGTQRTAQRNGGYATSLPDRPNAPTKAQQDALDRSLKATGRTGNKGPSMSAGARSAIGAEKAAGKSPSGLY